MPESKPEFLYKRVLLKVSGEVLMGDQAYGIDTKTVDAVAAAVAAVARQGVEICLVIGGGNIFRGLSKAAEGMDRANAAILYTSDPALMSRNLDTPDKRAQAFEALVAFNKAAPYEDISAGLTADIWHDSALAASGRLFAAEIVLLLFR